MTRWSLVLTLFLFWIIAPTQAQETAVQELKLSHTEEVTSAGWSPNGKQVITLANKTAYVWDVITGTQLFSAPHDTRSDLPRISPDGQQIAVWKDTAVQILGLNPQRIIATLRHESAVMDVVWSPDSHYLAVHTAGFDITLTSQIVLWEIATQTQMNTLAVNHPLVKLSWSPQSAYLSIASGTEGIQVMRAADGALMPFSQNGVFSGDGIGWRADESQVLIGGILGKVMVFDPVSNAVLLEITDNHWIHWRHGILIIPASLAHFPAVRLSLSGIVKLGSYSLICLMRDFL